MTWPGQTEQLSAGTSGKFEAPARPSHSDLPHAISMTRYAHGEIRISIYPVQTHQRARRVTHAVAGSVNPCSYVPQEAVRKRLVQHMLGEGSLDRGSKFQGIYEKPAKRRRLPRKKIFRSQARRQILECAAIAEEKFGKNCVMFTATVPGSGWRIAATVAKASGKIVNRIKQIFRDNLMGEYSLFGVWEWQKRGMLHLHIGVASNEVEKLEKLRQEWKERWINLLLDISFEEKRDLFRKNESWTWQDDTEQVQCDASWVQHSIGRYLSKYVCKGVTERTRGRVFYPSKWTTVDRKTAAEARERRVQGKRAGFTLGAVQSFLRRWVDETSEQAQKIFSFCNKQFPACGGVIMFTEIDRSIILAEDFLVGLREFSVMASRLKAA